MRGAAETPAVALSMRCNTALERCGCLQPESARRARTEVPGVPERVASESSLQQLQRGRVTALQGCQTPSEQGCRSGKPRDQATCAARGVPSGKAGAAAEAEASQGVGKTVL